MPHEDTSPESARIGELEQELQRTREDCRQARRRLDELTGLINRSSAVVFRWRVEPGVWPVDYVSENIRQFGYTPDDFISGRVSWPGITHPDDVPRLEAEVAEYTARGERQFHQLYRILTGTGEVRCIDDHTVAVFDDAGRLTHYEGLLLDISEQHALEEKLVHCEAERRLIVEHSLDVLYILDARTGVVTYVSPAITRWGLLPDEVIGGPFTAFIHPDDVQHMQQDLQRTVTTGEEFLSRFRVVTPKGRITPVEELGNAVRQHGEVVQIIGVVRDITERLQAEEVLRESERKFTTFFEFAPIPIAITVAGNRYLEVNAAFERVVGFPREEVRGRTPEELGIVVDPADFAQAGHLVQSEEPVHDYEMRFRRQDGQVRIGLFAAQRIEWGEAHAYLTAVVDITERKLAEEELRRAYAGVEMQIRERTAELARANQSLRESEERLERTQEIAHLGSWELDLTADVLIWSDEVYRIFGLEPREFGATYEAFLEYVHPDDRAAVDAAYRGSVREGRESYEIEHRVVRQHTGEIRSVHEKCLHFRDAAGLIVRSVGMVHDITERKRAEERVARLVAILDATPDFVAIADAKRKVLYYNPAARRMLGIGDGEDIATIRISDTHPSWAADIVLHQAMPIAAQQGTWSGETTLLSRDGREIPVSQVVIAHKSADGHVEYFSTIARDITERKRIEKALQASEKRFYELSQLAPVGIFSGDAGGNVTYVNQRWSEITGWPMEQGLGLKWMAGIHPDDRAYVERERMHTFHERRETILEYRYLTPDDRLKWIIVNVRPLQDEHGALTGFIGTVLDITERKRAEEQVRQLLHVTEQWAAEMDATITAIADGVLVSTPQLDVARSNTAACALFGYPRARLEAPLAEWLALVQLSTPEGQPIPLEDTAAYHAAVLGATTQGKIEQFSHADGTRRWISVSAAPIRTAEGELLGAVTTFADITPVRELQQRQEDLLHIVSHDLRIPITVIHGHMELLEAGLRQRQLDGELTLSTGTIDRNVHRLNNMIQDLVDMARLEGHQFAMKWDTVALQAYLPDLLHRLQHIFPVQRVTADIPADLPPARADVSRLERILLNLLSNAFKYSAEESPVRVRASLQDDEIVVAVSDQGRGIAPADLPHLFERFYRAGERRAEGVGLGLYITTLLVEAHGGRLWVESEVGKGSTFFFTLPVLNAPTPSEGSP